ncbi:alpha/beta fold hydrolase [Streptococcus thoraltensis]
MKAIKVATKRGSVLDGVLFDSHIPSKTVLIAITGIHGNFYSNPFYVTIGETLNRSGFDFIYAQTNDAFNEIPTQNVRTGQTEVIGSWNEDFRHTDEDIEAYIAFAQQKGYENIILAGHSLGANKVIYYLSRHQEAPICKFILLSPANLTHLTSQVSQAEKDLVRELMATGRENERLPFELLGWIPGTAKMAAGWLFDNVLNNVHVEEDGDFSQIAAIQQTGALLIGTYDRFTYGDPRWFLENINNHFQHPERNQLLFIEQTGHTFQQKEQELADQLLALLEEWTREEE